MAHELIKFDDLTAAFAPHYFGSTDYYAALASYGTVYVDTGLKADKRLKAAHRCTIVDTRDEIMLTVPVAPVGGGRSWNETAVSAHGRWWHVHRIALESAYGRTPFFEYYIDRFNSIFDCDYTENTVTVGQLDRKCDGIIRNILGIDNEVIYLTPDTVPDRDYRRVRSFENSPVSYYQLRADRLGFRPGLSVLDLIFNVGPEAPLVLRQIIDS